MKMRKLISVLATLSMLSTIGLTNVFAHETTAPVVKTTVTKLGNEEFNELYEEDIPEGYDAYTLAIDVENIKDQMGYTKTSGTASKPKYSGTALDNMEIILTGDKDVSVINSDYTYILDTSTNSKATVNEGVTSNGWTCNYAGNFVYPSEAGTNVTDSTSDYITVGFVVAKGETINFTTEGSFSLITYKDGMITSQSNYTNVNGATTLSFSPATITLGATVEPTVEPTVDPSSVTLNKETLSMKPGDTATLKETVSPDDAKNKTVTWETSDANVARVVDGVVTAVADGTANITVKTCNNLTAVCTVTVATPVPTATCTPAGTNAWDVSIANFDNTKTYAAKFTAGAESKEFDIDGLNAIESEGSVAFGAFVNTKRANVTLQILVK